MRICQVITRLIIGGAQENTVLTCRGLVERGHHVTLVAGPETGPEGSLWDAAGRSGAELVKLDSLRRAVRPALDWRALRDLAALFRDRRPDVVHTHSSKAGILARWAAHRAGVPVIVHTIHGMSFNRTQSAPVQALYRLLERRAARVSAALVTVADAMIEQSLAAGLAPRERFVTVRSGMETDVFSPDPAGRAALRRQWGIAPDEVVVGTVARLFENKGYDEIIAAMPAAVARAPRMKFVWVGDGKHRTRYERRLTQLGLRERVHLVGLVRPDEIPGYLRGFDLLVHASRWEGLPRAVVQALLTEVPAVSFDNDGAPEAVVPEETGILVPYGDTKGLAEGIVHLAEDAELRQRLGRQGRRRCLAEFDWRRMVEQLEALYVRLASDRAALQGSEATLRKQRGERRCRATGPDGG
ncbi:MAG TPA: glycosyltransferase family 4 protein [Phycisphaerae bacterium]|nr:glycosyltransferase family 4 protein [Phycisphaerae bacterium]HNU46718.1 glycosyltransferase family 4 protein [Phycisphaerae bacterium]